jgi:RNA polymerase sigma-70 factor (ECF subfamily)
LMSEFRPALRKLAGLLFRDTRRLDASDIVQETLLDACRCPEKVRTGTAAQKFAWLRRVLVHNILDARRDQRRAKRRQSRDRSLRAADVKSLVSDEHSSPLARAEAAEDWARVNAALAGLRPLHRKVTFLFFWEDCSLADVAERCGLSKSAARGLLGGALDHIQQMISDRPPMEG